MKKIIIAGAGMGGLISAGLLAKRGYQVKVFERSPIAGGRAHIWKKDGFTMSYGAHAVVCPGIDPVKSVFRELGIHLHAKSPSLSKFKLYSDGKLSAGILGTGAFTTAAVSGLRNRLVFFAQFFKMIKAGKSAASGMTVGEWIQARNVDPSVAKALRAYAALTFYDGALNQLPIHVFSAYAKKIYMNIKPLIYASYEQLLQQLEEAIVGSGGSIAYSTEVVGLAIEENKVTGVETKEGIEQADEVILNLPTSALRKLCTHQLLTGEIGPFLDQPACHVFVYDLMLSRNIRTDVTNVLDLDHGVYINDYSLNVPSSAPKGKQLLTCLRFLDEQEQSNDSHADHSRQMVEDVLDNVYPEWRNYMAGRRIINRAAVNSLAKREGVSPLPLHSRTVRGLHFVGDSAESFGGLGVPAYDSALQVTNAISR